MIKKVFFPKEFNIKSYTDSNLKLDDLNWSKRAEEIQEYKTEELRQLAHQEYKMLLKKLSKQPIDGDRTRFLETVKSSFEIYIFQETAEIEHPSYYILLYYLEKKTRCIC